MLILWWIIIGTGLILILGGGAILLSSGRQVTNPAGRRLLWLPLVFGVVILIIGLMSAFR